MLLWNDEKGGFGRIHWVGQKVRSAFSIASYGKTKTKFLANPRVKGCGLEREKDYVSSPSTPDDSTIVYRYIHGLSSLGNQVDSHLGGSRLVLLF